MDNREVEALAARLAVVERRFRTATMVWLGIVIAVIVLSIGAQRAFSQTQTVQTRELDIVDGSGRTRIALALSTNGNPGMWVYDANGKTRAYLGPLGRDAADADVEPQRPERADARIHWIWDDRRVHPAGGSQ